MYHEIIIVISPSSVRACAHTPQDHLTQRECILINKVYITCTLLTLSARHGNTFSSPSFGLLAAVMTYSLLLIHKQHLLWKDKVQNQQRIAALSPPYPISHDFLQIYIFMTFHVCSCLPVCISYWALAHVQRKIMYTL